MSSKLSTIEELLFSHVQAFLEANNIVAAFPNVDFNPPATSHLRIDHLPNSSTRLSLGANDVEEDLGILQITVVAVDDTGTAPASRLVEKVCDHFPASLILRKDGVSVHITKRPDVATPAKEDAHWTVPVSVSYQSFN